MKAWYEGGGGGGMLPTAGSSSDEAGVAVSYMGGKSIVGVYADVVL